MTTYRTHTCGELRLQNVSQTVTLCGWVSKRRNLGAICFIDLRDRYGITQITFAENFSDKIKDIRNEYVLQIKGEVVKKQTPNFNLATGEIEVKVSEVKILSSAKTTPLIIAEQTDALEDTRLHYRYLDLRRHPLQERLLFRDKVCTLFREYLHSLNFVEVETPILSKSTPEGARDYLVPSRLYNGNFYALPQSPQIYKQLLMIGGLDRYFQIARCFRDEDLRSDRQPEFTQIDIEMSFASEEDIFAVVEGAMKKLFAQLKGIKLDTFPRLTYKEAMSTYGSDKPDLRFTMKMQTLNSIFSNSSFVVFKNALKENKLIKGLKVERLLSRKEIDNLNEYLKVFKAQGLAFVKYENKDFNGGIAKYLNSKEKNELFKLFALKEGETLLFVADKTKIAEVALGAIRTKIGREDKLYKEDDFNFVWIVDFPMYEYSEEKQRYEAAHHPFTAPRDEDIDKLINNKENCYSRAYDLVLNGYELLSGSVRIFNQAMQAKVFKALGLSPEKAKERFGFFLEAFEYGAPPHCGVGIGLERLLMIMTGTDNIKDVIAFPKTQSAMDLMAQAPSDVDSEQLHDLGIEISKK